MLKLTVTFSGVDAILRNAGEKAAEAKHAAVAEMTNQAEAVMAASKPLVPVATGVLRASGFVSPPIEHGNTTTVELGYGGAAAPYAAIVHEDLDAVHHVGQAKFLEQPLLEAVPDIERALMSAVTDALKK